MGSVGILRCVHPRACCYARAFPACPSAAFDHGFLMLSMIAEMDGQICLIFRVS